MLRFEWIWMKIDAKILLIGTESTLKSAKNAQKGTEDLRNLFIFKIWDS
jgi:hypothetical protein